MAFGRRRDDERARVPRLVRRTSLAPEERFVSTVLTVGNHVAFDVRPARSSVSSDGTRAGPRTARRAPRRDGELELPRARTRAASPGAPRAAPRLRRRRGGRGRGDAPAREPTRRVSSEPCGCRRPGAAVVGSAVRVRRRRVRARRRGRAHPRARRHRDPSSARVVRAGRRRRRRPPRLVRVRPRISLVSPRDRVQDPTAPLPVPARARGDVRRPGPARELQPRPRRPARVPERRRSRAHARISSAHARISIARAATSRRVVDATRHPRRAVRPERAPRRRRRRDAPPRRPLEHPRTTTRRGPRADDASDAGESRTKTRRGFGGAVARRRARVGVRAPGDGDGGVRSQRPPRGRAAGDGGLLPIHRSEAEDGAFGGVAIDDQGVVETEIEIARDGPSAGV